MVGLFAPRYMSVHLANVFTGVLKKNKETGELTNDWRDLDKRIDFIRKIGADPIMCVSYMPQVLDAVPNNERQSAPKDYALWEQLCFQAAKHNLERGTRVPFWEVWNEVNTGWLKPGPDDTGSEEFRKLYFQALGKEDTNTTTIRRFEAYCKLYRATARGIRSGAIARDRSSSSPWARRRSSASCSTRRDAIARPGSIRPASSPAIAARRSAASISNSGASKNS